MLNGGVALANKLIDLDATAVERDDLAHTLDGQGDQIGERIGRTAETHRASQDVALDQEVLAVHCLQRLLHARELAARVRVRVVLIDQTALQFAALTCQLLGVERDLLHTCGIGRNRRERRNPRRAAELATAGTQTADATCLLTRTDLFHLDANTELLGKNLDQLAEIDALVSDVVENSFDLIALILNVANLHIQTHIGCDTARADHRVVFEGDSLLPLFDVVGFGFAIDLFELAAHRGESDAEHLTRNHIARERHDTDVVTG